MFGRLNLMKDGARVDGLIVRLDRHTPKVSMYGNVTIDTYVITLKVTFEDGTTTEVECRVKEDTYRGPLLLGKSLPLRYDPDDRSRIELDLDAMKAGEHKQHKQAQAEAEAFARNAPGARLDELERLRAEGVITQEQFQAESDKLLDLL
jgi:hypothetical protein